MQVVSLAGAQKASLHPDDMLLLSNFIMSSESFRQVKLTFIRLLSFHSFLSVEKSFSLMLRTCYGHFDGAK